MTMRCFVFDSFHPKLWITVIQLRSAVEIQLDLDNQYTNHTKVFEMFTTIYINISTKICLFTQQGICFCFVTSWQNIFGKTVKYTTFNGCVVVAVVTTIRMKGLKVILLL